MDSQTQIKIAESYRRECDIYIDKLEPLLLRRSNLQRTDILLALLIHLTPVSAAGLAIYAYITSSPVLYSVLLVIITLPSALWLRTRKDIEAVNYCHTVYTKLIAVKEDIARDAIIGALDDETIKSYCQVLTKIRKAFVKAMEIEPSNLKIIADSIWSAPEQQN